jgi:Bacteriophage tail sheath protein
MLNPRTSTCTARSRTLAKRVWGARTLSSYSQWRYITVRRLFLFVEESIEEGT